MTGTQPAIGYETNRLDTNGADRRRVVLVAEATGGGVGRHVLDLAECLPGYHLDVLLLYGVRRMADGFEERVLRAADAGYRAVPLDLVRSPGLQDIAAVKALRRAIAEFGGAHVLHGHSSKAGLLTRLARWGSAKRVIYTPNAFYTQNPTLSRRRKQMFGAAELALSAVADRIITVSTEETLHARALGISRRKLVQIENGIEPWVPSDVAHHRERTRRALGVGPDDVIVGFLGRLVAQKDPALALRVFRQLIDRNFPGRMVLAGDGPLAGDVRELLGSLGLQDRVQWLPNVRGPETIPAFDVFLMTSRYEGFPYVLLEALNSGCAIVTTSVGGAVDCVRGGKNGEVVASPTPDALARAVYAMACSPARLAAARDASRTLASHFSIDRMVRRTVALYRLLHAHR